MEFRRKLIARKANDALIIALKIGSLVASLILDYLGRYGREWKGGSRPA